MSDKYYCTLCSLYANGSIGKPISGRKSKLITESQSCGIFSWEEATILDLYEMGYSPFLGFGCLSGCSKEHGHCLSEHATSKAMQITNAISRTERKPVEAMTQAAAGIGRPSIAV